MQPGSGIGQSLMEALRSVYLWRNLIAVGGNCQPDAAVGILGRLRLIAERFRIDCLHLRYRATNAGR